jgi:hypothetical protein
MRIGTKLRRLLLFRNQPRNRQPIRIQPRSQRSRLRAGEIPLTGSMTLVSSADSVISHIVTMKAEEVAAPVEGAAPAAAAEPEVMKKGKKEEEGADAAAKPGAKDAKPAAAKPAKDAKKK